MTVTWKHYIKPPSIEAVSAMQRLSDTLTIMQKPPLLPDCSPVVQKEGQAQETSKWIMAAIVSVTPMRSSLVVASPR
jgi:hypothetical protein